MIEEKIIFTGKEELTGYRKAVYDLCLEKMSDQMSDRDKEILKWRCAFMAKPTANSYSELDWEDADTKKRFLEVLSAYEDYDFTGTEGIDIGGIVFTYKKNRIDLDKYIDTFRRYAKWNIAHPNSDMAQDSYFAYIDDLEGNLVVY